MEHGRALSSMFSSQKQVVYRRSAGLHAIGWMEKAEEEDEEKYKKNLKIQKNKKKIFLNRNSRYLN